MKERINVWVLIDDIIGNANQALALAKILDLSPTQIKLKYNNLALLPNFMLGKTLRTINKDNKKLITKPYPDLVISAGRRTVPIARYIKSQSKNTKLIHVLWPEVGINEFDLIITPEHDNKFGDNIINVKGAISAINQKELDGQKQKYLPNFEAFKKPLISLFIGGRTKKGQIKISDLKNLIELVNKLNQASHGTLLISTSRRTDKKLAAEIPNLVTTNYQFYDYNSQEASPYLSYLACSDAIILTGDSISMAVDACLTGKPVYIYIGNFMTDKQKIFVETLFDAKYAYNIKLINEIDFTKKNNFIENFENLKVKIMSKLN